VRQWAEAAAGRRQLARALRQLSLDGFEIRDVLIDADSAQHSDRLFIGPTGVYVVGFRTPSGNVWRPRPPSGGAAMMAARARATFRLSEVVGASLMPNLNRLHIGVHALFTVIGPEQEPGAMIAGLPLLGPLGLVEHLRGRPRVLSALQVSALVDRVDDWLALRSVTGLQSKADRRRAGRSRHGAL
jgi:hypothetical protein